MTQSKLFYEETFIILFLDKDFYNFIKKKKEKTSFSTRHESTNVYIKLILEDIRRTAEHASDIAEAAMKP